jgi:hypothetical protein
MRFFWGPTGQNNFKGNTETLFAVFIYFRVHNPVNQCFPGNPCTVSKSCLGKWAIQIARQASREEWEYESSLMGAQIPHLSELLRNYCLPGMVVHAYKPGCPGGRD